MPDGTTRPGRTEPALATLDVAVTVARAGDQQYARELCSVVLHEMQPVLARRPELLARLMHALLVSYSIRLISCLVMALTGRRMRILLLLPQAPGSAAPPNWHEETWETVLTVDPRWLGELSRDDAFLRLWCEALAAGSVLPNRAGSMRALHHGAGWRATMGHGVPAAAVPVAHPCSVVNEKAAQAARTAPVNASRSMDGAH